MPESARTGSHLWQLIAVFAFATAFSSHPAIAQTPVFDDEFSGYHLDTSRWTVENFAGKGLGTFRAEPVFYKPEAISVNNHALRITVEHVPSQDPKSGIVVPLRSGRIESRQSFLYGKFVFRAKLMRGQGLWPAIWMRTPFGQPFNGEIDVLEGHGSHPNIIQSTMHPWVNGVEPREYCSWLLVQSQPDGDAYHGTGCDRLDNKVHLSSDLAASFHEYTVLWVPGKITWYIDGQLYYQVTERVPNVPMMIVINVSFSHNWDGGSPDAAPLPQSLEVQYVRVYPMTAP